MWFAGGCRTERCACSTHPGTQAHGWPGMACRRGCRSSSGLHGIGLDQHAVQIQPPRQLPEHRPLVVLAGGAADLAAAVRLLGNRLPCPWLAEAATNGDLCWRLPRLMACVWRIKITPVPAAERSWNFIRYRLDVARSASGPKWEWLQIGFSRS